MEGKVEFFLVVVELVNFDLLKERMEGNVKVIMGGVFQKKMSMVCVDFVNLVDIDMVLECYFNRVQSWIFLMEIFGLVEEWEINFCEIIFKNIIVCGIFGIVYKGVYKGQDVVVKLLEWGEENIMKKFEVQYYCNQFC